MSIKKINLFIREITVIYFKRRAALLAKGLAYSILTGSIPLLFLAIYSSKYLLQLIPAYQSGFQIQLDTLIPKPLADVLIQQAVQLVDKRSWSAIGILGIAGVLLVTRGLFSSLENSLEMVMKSPKEKRLWTKQLLYLFLTVFAISLFFIASYVSTALTMLYKLTGISTSYLWLGTKTSSVILLWGAFVVIYRICYHGTMHAGVLFLVSFIVALVWQVVNYLGYSLVSFTGENAIFYGFLAGVVVFLVWSYLFAIFLFVGGIIISRYSQQHDAAKKGAFHVFR